jgi:hypothetical protein
MSSHYATTGDNNVQISTTSDPVPLRQNEASARTLSSTNAHAEQNRMTNQQSLSTTATPSAINQPLCLPRKSSSGTNTQFASLAPSPQDPPTILPHEYTPKASDVCCGRGKTNWKHVGNKSFRALIQLHVDTYMRQTLKKQKTAVVRSIVQEVLSSGGRFIAMKGNRWCDIGYQQACEKVGHSLRDYVNASEKTHRVKDDSTGARHVAASNYQDGNHNVNSVHDCDFGDKSKSGRQAQLPSSPALLPEPNHLDDSFRPTSPSTESILSAASSSSSVSSSKSSSLVPSSDSSVSSSSSVYSSSSASSSTAYTSSAAVASLSSSSSSITSYTSSSSSSYSSSSSSSSTLKSSNSATYTTNNVPVLSFTNKRRAPTYVDVYNEEISRWKEWKRAHTMHTQQQRPPSSHFQSR